jgi:four helix bundle protein
VDEALRRASEEIEYPISNKEFPMMKEREYDLQDRLVDYSVRIIKLSESLPETKAGKHVSLQILRSGTSPAPNYGEAQSAESKADFVHKLKISLKELRETEIWLKVISKVPMVESENRLAPLLQESDELIAILFKSVETAKKGKDR